MTAAEAALQMGIGPDDLERMLDEMAKDRLADASGEDRITPSQVDTMYAEYKPLFSGWVEEIY
ncbi:MAG: hypothetical protein WD645_06575 [Dehalococcoidia bacterium]